MPVSGMSFCNLCDNFGHRPTFCWKKKKHPLKSNKKLKKLGKNATKWKETKAVWFREHPQESFNCYLCGRWMAKSETSLDHIQPRGSHPELRYVQSNLAPCCWECNGKKGSLSLERYKEKNVR